MHQELVAVALLSGLALAAPPPLPAITPPPLLPRQDDGSDNIQGCTLTFNSETVITNTFLDIDDSDQVFTATDIYTIPAQDGCNCNDGAIAGTYTSIGRDGGTTVWCATGTPYLPENAQSTIQQPEPTPGSADNSGWAQVQCDVPSLTEIYNDPWQQWNDSGATAAWAAVSDAWDRAPDAQKDSLSAFIGNYFHAKPFHGCENLGDGPCIDGVQCGANADGGDVTAPAGYVILNSFVGLHNNLANMYDAINDGLNFAEGKIGTFVQTLSPINEDIEDERRTRIAFDIAQATLFAVLAPTFHSGFARVPWVQANPNAVAAGFDFTYGMVGTSFAIAKDTMEGLTTVPATNELSSLVVETAKSWLQAVTGIGNSVLNDASVAIDFIDQGKFFVGEGIGDPINATMFVEKALLAGLLSAVWVTGDPREHGAPVIMTSDDVPQDGSGCESYDPAALEFDSDLEVSFDDDVLETARACIGDTPYWLLGARLGTVEAGGCNPPTGGPGGVVTPPSGNCDRPAVLYEGLYNLESIGTFNLTKEEVVGNAVNSWTANGNQNDWDPLQLADADSNDITALITQNLGATKGVVRIPVCTFREVVAYLGDSEDSSREDNPNFPCPPS